MNIEVNLHPNYRVFAMSPVEVIEELLTWSRDEMIAWLCWIDPLGIYTDKEMVIEYGDILWRNQAVELILYKIEVMGEE